MPESETNFDENLVSLPFSAQLISKFVNLTLGTGPMTAAS